MKHLPFIFMFFLSLGSWAHATEQEVAIAECTFNRYAKAAPWNCSAIATMCIDVLAARRGNCPNRLKIECDQKEVFMGTWTPGYFEHPETLIIQADQELDQNNAARISITPGSRNDQNDSVLTLSGAELNGNCRLRFDSIARFKTKILTGENSQ